MLYIIEMLEDDKNVEVDKVNAEFYRAFESLSIERMERLWKHDENIACIHPGWDLFIGWLAIRESWITIFANTEMIKFTITNPKIRIFDNNKIAVVVCLENIETTAADRRPIKIGIIATNIFERNEQLNQWLLIHHHGSPVTNYIPPNISSQQ
ncbi:MAG: nuclear transport factor 2 family protein [Nitrososphaeraceae archaeon]